MLIIGIEKVSLNDFYGKISCVLFVSGCNFSCPYCHNPQTVLNKEKEGVDVKEIMDLIKERKNIYDGIVISGGEPTIDDGLLDLCYSIKKMGYKLKLDTNGSRPDVLSELLDRKLIDYISMDIKTYPSGVLYRPFTAETNVVNAVRRSIDILMSSATDYEFRTTCVNSLIDKETIKQICYLIKDAKRYTLQPYNRNVACILNKGFFNGENPFIPEDEMISFLKIVKPMVKNCSISGL